MRFAIDIACAFTCGVRQVVAQPKIDPVKLRMVINTKAIVFVIVRESEHLVPIT